MSRPKMPIGQHGAINYVRGDGKWTAKCKVRCNDGRLRQLERTRTSKLGAQMAVEKACENIRQRSFGTIDLDTKLEDLAQRFMFDVRAKRTNGTIQTYGTAVRHITKRLGAYAIQEATPARLQDFIDYVVRHSGADQAKSCRTVLSGMFGMAIREGALVHNPVNELERIEHVGKRGSDAIPLEDLPYVLKAIDDSKLAENDEADVFRFMAGTGFRAGEALGLCWDCVDFRHHTVTVKRIAKRVKGKGMALEEHAKTETSARTISVPSCVMELLQRRHDVQASRGGGKPNDLVFPMPLGGIRDVGLLDRHLRGVRKQLGCENLRITSHSFRKTCASILHRQGLADLDVADYLGHSDVSTTQRVYIARGQKSEEAAMMLEEAFTIPSHS
ncbi:tyrosine-type recombinase/integrase [Bifidobacterium sp.]|uniref:tyrosine-type recombinase/integrase n=1 Tax=Bifidobacterium sp. TaxID=41200 RepID=UPI003D7CA3DC